MGALLHNTTFIEHHNIIRIFHSRESVGYNDYCTASVKFRKIFYNASFVLGVE